MRININKLSNRDAWGTARFGSDIITQHVTYQLN